jgi:mannitol-1-phosphate/altronate dehydrogenase
MGRRLSSCGTWWWPAELGPRTATGTQIELIPEALFETKDSATLHSSQFFDEISKIARDPVQKTPKTSITPILPPVRQTSERRESIEVDKEIIVLAMDYETEDEEMDDEPPAATPVLHLPLSKRPDLTAPQGWAADVEDYAARLAAKA